MNKNRGMELQSFLDSRFCRVMARILVFLLVVQSGPLLELRCSCKGHQGLSSVSLLRVENLLTPRNAYSAPNPALPGDIDDDCNVDRDDLNILMADRNKTVENSSCGEPCDLDGDGIITVLDARKLVLLCTLSRCAIMANSCTENHPPIADAGPDQTSLFSEIRLFSMAVAPVMRTATP